MMSDISTICLFFHKWSKWEKPFRVYDSNWYQVRHCTKCGKVQKRNVGFIQSDRLES
jgi:hypothetical protein